MGAKDAKAFNRESASKSIPFKGWQICSFHVDEEEDLNFIDGFLSHWQQTTSFSSSKPRPDKDPKTRPLPCRPFRPKPRYTDPSPGRFGSGVLPFGPSRC